MEKKTFTRSNQDASAEKRLVKRLPKIALEKPFTHRTRRSKEGALKALLKVLSLPKQRATGFALGALHILLKDETNHLVARSALKGMSGSDELQVVARHLVTALRSKAPEALTAKVTVDDSGRLVGEKQEEEPSKEERAGLHSENQTVIYPSQALYPKSDILRLYK